MNGCAPHLNATSVEDNQLRSVMEPAALTAKGRRNQERAVRRVRIERPLVRRDGVPEILPLDPRDPDVRRAKALVGGATAS